MPVRPREHEIETESRRAFASMVPASWVVRDVQEDYGVDLEVEIFEQGRATGLTFRVQLKGTDTAPRKGRISRPGIKASTLSYWNSLDTPVLVALYSTANNTFYGRWAHGYDRYYMRSQEAKTLTFSYNPADKIDLEYIKRLPSDVRFIRSVQRNDLTFPMPVFLKIGSSVQGHSDKRLAFELRQAIEATDGLLYHSVEQDASVVLSIESDAITAVLPTRVRTSTIHLEPDAYRVSDGLKGIAADAMLALANVFISIGDIRSAVGLVDRFAQYSLIMWKSPALEHYLEHFLKAGYTGGAFRLIERFIDSKDRDEREIASHVMTAIFVSNGPFGLSRSESDRMIERMNSRAEVERKQLLSAAAGKTLYCIGEVYRARKEYQAAVDALDSANVSDPTYSRRGYFWRVRGGLHYELKRFDEAIGDYRKAISCGDSPEASFLLADVLVHAGRYEEASGVEIRSDAIDYYALGERTARRVISIINSRVGVAVQDRTRLSREAADELIASHDADRIVAALRSHDALDTRLWYALVPLLWESDPDFTMDCLLMLADFERDNAKCWALAACHAVGERVPEDLVDDLCDNGIKWCGHGFLDAVEALCELSGGDFSEAVRDKVYERAEMERPRWPRVVRFVDDDGTYQVLEIP
ncbi:DUF4365 domain-containing protein [Catellatospora citrea]|nr:DUF4365 domain-containing protein [Catellatospora citrea]